MDCPSYDKIIKQDMEDMKDTIKKKKERKLNEINKWNKWVINTNIIKNKKDNTIRISRFEKVKYIAKFSHKSFTINQI